MRTLRFTGPFPSGKPPAAPGSFELSSGLPLLTISSHNPTFAHTEVLLSTPPGKILKD